MTPADATDVLTLRLKPRKAGVLDIVAPLQHFALVTYAVPVERLTPHIPADRFEIPTFEIDGERLALLSVVPFVDAGFRFRLAPFPRFHFAQTNYRVYVIDRASGEHCLWFFGTTLGGWPVHIARFLWKIPWHPAKYTWACDIDEASGRYTRFRYEMRSRWGEARVDVRDTGVPASLLPGLESMEEQVLILTHPVDGYFYRLDGKLGTYSVSHERMELTVAEPIDLYFGLLERLGVLTAEEMQRPHSALICPETLFRIHMPPRRV
jgi:hypothetical protein